MPPFLSPLWVNERLRARILVRIGQRRRPERRLLGMLAAAAQHDDRDLIDAALTEALDWPEAAAPEALRKATLLFAMTTLLARARYTEYALRLAPLIPSAPGMTQVLVFSTEEPRQRFCWRVTPAYALVHSRAPSNFPVAPLVQPYRDGQVSIDHAYLRRVLLPRRRKPRPILLLPHPLGMVHISGASYVILDGNHRVVCAWQQQRWRIPGFILTPQEATAVLVSHSCWPPYSSTSASNTVPHEMHWSYWRQSATIASSDPAMSH
jgi:hypothetical protein